MNFNWAQPLFEKINKTKVWQFLRRYTPAFILVYLFLYFMYEGVGELFYKTTDGDYKWIPLIALILIVCFKEPKAVIWFLANLFQSKNNSPSQKKEKSHVL